MGPMRLPRFAIGVRMLTLGAFASAATVYIPPSGAIRLCAWRYSTGMSDPGADWREVGFDDSAWGSGGAPFGYGLAGFVRYGTELKDMRGRYSTVYFRKSFQVDDLAQADALKLSVNHSGGFIAWINGVQVAAANAPPNPRAAARATGEHAPSDAHRYEVVALPRDCVRVGRNVLAVQLFNASRESPAAHFDASLVNTRNLAFNQPATASFTNRARNNQPYAFVDGTRLTFWSAKDKTTMTPEWVAVDLGREQEIERMRLTWWGGKRPGVGAVPNLEAQVSTNGSDWRTVGSSAHTGGENTFAFPAQPARYVRMIIPAKDGKTGGLLDFEVYGAGVPLDSGEGGGVALGKPVTASSMGAPQSWPVAKVVDDNPVSWWISKKGAPEPQWLEIDLERVHRLSGVKLYFGENHARQFVVQVARQKGAWREVAYETETEEIGGGDVHRIHRVNFAALQDARYVRLELRDAAPNPDHFVVTEFVVLGRPLAMEEKEAGR